MPTWNLLRLWYPHWATLSRDRLSYLTHALKSLEFLASFKLLISGIISFPPSHHPRPRQNKLLNVPMLYRKKIGKEGKKEGGREEKETEEERKCPATFSATNRFTLIKLNFFPPTAFSCPSLDCQHYSAVATPINTAATHHLQFLYLLTVYSSPKIFLRTKEKEKINIFCTAAALGILNSERNIHNIKLACKQTRKTLFSQSPLKNNNFFKKIINKASQNQM